MKSVTLLAASLLTGHALAFPAYANGILDGLAARAAEQGSFALPAKRDIGFDPALQYVSNKGKHKFVAPGPNDARGPCPGLNAMANHGYLPHNGVASIEQMVTANYDVFGMGVDLGSFLSVYGSMLDGNTTAFSIGGPTSALGVLLGQLGTPQGMSGSHNKYENDASPMRGDLYLYGNDYLTQVSNFQYFYNMKKGVPDSQVNYDLDTITAFRKYRYDSSLSTNPYFFYGPFSGAIAIGAAYSFIYRFMANKSAEYPEGRLDRETLKSFYAISGSSGKFKYTPGHEKIPNNWYKRAIGDEYTIPYLTADSLKMILTHLEFLSIGGNLGTVNSFAGLDPGNLTGGVYELSTLTQGNNFACFIFEIGLSSLPDLLKGLFTDVTAQQSVLAQAFFNATANLSCPAVETLQYGQFGEYPGFTMPYDGYTPL